MCLSDAPKTPDTSHRSRRRIGPFELGESIGRGGMGVVYLARQTATGQKVALKILPRDLATDQQYLSRFKREALAVSRLNHPNIVTVLDHGNADGLHYIALEYVEGKTLERMIREEGAFDEAEIIEITDCVARALHHAHSHGVLHRDVKPGNILVTPAGEVKLADFGMAKYEESQLSFQTTAGRVFGTPAFLSPEQALGAQDVDRRSDIYSLGCVIFNMASGRPPFQGDNPFAVIDQHRRSPPPAVRALNPRISTALESLIERAMAKLPEHRYQTAEELIWDLELIRQALRAPHNVRGGLASIVAALDQVNVVSRKIKGARASVPTPGWQMRLTAAFLARPLLWFGVIFVLILAGWGLAVWELLAR